MYEGVEMIFEIKQQHLCFLRVSIVLAGFLALSSARAEEIVGQVQDALGHPISGADIRILGEDGHLGGATKTNESGGFSVGKLNSGIWMVEVKKTSFQDGADRISIVSGKNSKALITLLPVEVLALEATSHAASAPRNSVSVDSGSSDYRMTDRDIQNLPYGENTPINEVLLQAPGVVNDSWGQIHVRGDHANVQYRINDFIMPQSITTFGQDLDTRFAQSIDLMAGALPAEYGVHTAGVVEINTKTAIENGGSISLFGGSNNTLLPSLQYGGSDGDLSYYFSGSYLTNNMGIGNPTSSVTPYHDNSEQSKGFAYLSYRLDPDTKISLMSGVYSGHFQIPNQPGLASGDAAGITNPYYNLANASPNNPYAQSISNFPASLQNYNSLSVNDQQTEQNHYVVLGLQKSVSDDLDYQISYFNNYSETHYIPDVNGNLAFNAMASDVLKSSTMNGVQEDTRYQLNDQHTVRVGFVGSLEDVTTNNTSTVFGLDPITGGITTSAYNIVDDQTKNGNVQLGVYAQDQWKLSNQVTMNYGARYDYFNAYVSGAQVSPRIGLVYQPTNQTTYHIGYARYFTPPPTELVSNTTQSLFVNTTGAIPGQNSSVKPESDNYYDVGWSHQYTESFTQGIDAFYKQSFNTLDEGQFGPAMILTPYNYAQGKIYGVEWTNNYSKGNVSAYLNVADNVSMAKDIVSSQYLFDQATLQYAANNWVNVDHEQALTVSSGGSYMLNGTKLNATMIFGSGLRDGFANTGTLPSYTVFNVGAFRTVNFDPTLGPVELRFLANNVLDRVYEIRDGSGIGVYAPVYGARRQFFAGITKHF